MDQEAYHKNSMLFQCKSKLIHYKKKAALLIGVSIVLILVLCSCSDDKPSVEKVKDLEYTVVGQDEQPENLKELLEEKKAEPFEVTYQEEGQLYICVGYGEQTTGGYSIQVEDCYLGKDEIYINTTLLGPTPQEQQDAIPSYPILVLKTEAMDLPVVFE